VLTKSQMLPLIDYPTHSLLAYTRWYEGDNNKKNANNYSKDDENSMIKLGK
jgi:hypothetical protein